MIVDDDDFTVDLYRMVLERSGYRFVCARSGWQALACLKEDKISPDLILVDCLMPEMDGETFLKKLQEDSPDTFVKSKVVGLTSFDSSSSGYKNMKAMAFDCREKPFNVSGLLKIVSDYIQEKKPLDKNYGVN